jgi:diadenylate cyclase
MLIKDYIREPIDEKVKEVYSAFTRMIGDELLEPHLLIRLLGYPNTSTAADELISPRGFRVLSKIPRLPSVIIHNLVDKFGSLPDIMSATIEELDEVDGIGEVRARTIKEGLKRIQDQVFIDRHI